MVDLSTILLFVGAALVLLITPGPAVIYIITRSIDQGRSAGIVSALGVSVGTFIHVVAAAMGLSAILVSSATAFSVVKYIGAAYLIYLGIKELVSRKGLEDRHFKKDVKLISVFWEAILVNLLNPKLALFMFAFLPQFVKVGNGPVSLQILTLGLILIGIGFCSDCSYALLSSGITGWLKKHPCLLSRQKRFTGSVYVALGLFTALVMEQKS